MNQKGVVVDDVNWPYGSDEQAQSQDRERLQEDIQEAFERLTNEHYAYGYEYSPLASEADIKLL
jgi:hypothetical protein